MPHDEDVNDPNGVCQYETYTRGALPQGDGRAYAYGGGCALAVLDGDHIYEIVDWGSLGLSIFDGDGNLLSRLPSFGTSAAMSPPLIADVDGDGSAEIVAVGHPDGDEQIFGIYIFGPANGRWARTRPVWHQLAYDPTMVRDDGTLVMFPKPNWQAYNSFRAQPAHDGDYPDLVVEVTESCATDCAADGDIWLNAVVSNLGSREAPAGARLVLYTFTEETGLIQVAAATLPDAVPSMTAAAGVLLQVPVASWGDRRVLEIEGAHDDECDLVNSRIDLWVDPCGAGAAGE